MEKVINKVFLHEKILQKVQEKCELTSEKKKFSFKELSNQLIYFLEIELQSLNKGLYFRYNNNNNSDKGLSATTISHAWISEGKKEDGAIKEFRDLLCYYAFKMNWSETLESLNIDEQEEIQRTIEKKEEYQSKREGIPYISKNSSEIRKFVSNIYLELITRKAGIPIDVENDVIEEIYNSWYKLFCIIREDIKALSTSSIGEQYDPESAVGVSIIILNNILRPHLTEHQARYRSWLEKARQNPEFKDFSPQELQKKYPDYNNLIKSLKDTNNKMINYKDSLHKMIL